MTIIQPVPRAEAERLFPHLTGQPIWGEESNYSMAQCKKLHYIAYGPVEPRALIEAARLFKSVKIVTRESKNDKNL